MQIVIEDCFQWINFHMMNKCLEEGHEVIGIGQVNLEREEFLYSMVGRNANFTLVDSRKDIPKEKNSSFLKRFKNVKEIRSMTDVNFVGDQYYLIEERSHENVNLDPNQCIIYLPPLIGPWMEKSRYEKTIESKIEVVFIEDFVHWFYRLIQTTYKPKHIMIHSNKENRNENADDISFLVYQSIEEGKKVMDAHIKKYPFYY